MSATMTARPDIADATDPTTHQPHPADPATSQKTWELGVPPREKFRTPSVERAPIVGQRKGTASSFTQRQVGTVVGDARLPLLEQLMGDDRLRRAVAQRTRIQVRTRGRTKEIELADLIAADVRTMQEVRRPAAHARRAAPSGLFVQRSDALEDADAEGAASGDDTYQVWHESALENSHLIVATADARYGAFTTQALDLQWTHEGMELQHIPDIVIEVRSGGTLVVDCRDADNRDDETFATQVALTASMCREVGWTYELWDRLPTELDCNLRSLESFVIVESSVAQAAREVALLCPKQFRTVAGFRAAAALRAGEGDVTSVLKHALWRGLVLVDLTRPVETHTELTPGTDIASGLVLNGEWREVVIP
jgi:hypothetical protein